MCGACPRIFGAPARDSLYFMKIVAEEPSLSMKRLVSGFKLREE
jgi:hypothetical protein